MFVSFFMYRICQTCCDIKPIHTFSPNSGPQSYSGLHKSCQECVSEKRIAVRRKKYKKREHLIKQKRDEQTEDDICCQLCYKSLVPKLFTTLEGDMAQFNNVCIFCELRVCTRCNECKYLSEFTRNARVKTGFHRSCTACVKKRLQ